MSKRDQNPEARRLVITLLVVLAAIGILLAVMFGGPSSQPEVDPDQAQTASATDDGAGKTTDQNDAQSNNQTQQVNDGASTDEAKESDQASSTDESKGQEPTPQEANAEGQATSSEGEQSKPGSDAQIALTGLRALSDGEPDKTATPLGGLTDPTAFQMELGLSRTGAGITSIVFSDIWQTAAANRQAQQHMSEIAAGEEPTVPFPEHRRYVLQRSQPYSWNANGTTNTIEVPILGVSLIKVADQWVSLFGSEIQWRETAPGSFEIQIVNEKDDPVLTVTRRFVLGDGFDITLEHTFTNLTNQDFEVVWVQYGPTDLDRDRARYMDRRRLRYGYELALVHDPHRLGPVIGDDILEEYSEVVGDYKDFVTEGAAAGTFELWPKAEAKEEGFTLSWFASTNRYFALAVHPLLGPEGKGNRSLLPEVGVITSEVQSHLNQQGDPEEVVFTGLRSEPINVAANASAELHLGLYAGPLDRHILSEEEPYSTLGMSSMILYVMSAMCACCTFQWLAIFLLDFLTFLHAYVVFDWGIAIIVLVICVRAILHPLTKKSQISMQRFSKQMGGLKPELDKLKKKFPNDKKRQQQEQMRLMQEQGINPLSMLGCLPLFLQMPIWVALYAMLYFAFDLRQEPAFFGFFQLFWDWPFLADLATPDHFFGEFEEPVELFGWVNITGLNLLPLLMAVMWYMQQKYFSPPPNPSMSKEMMRQQKFMQVMIIVVFPIMLYSAPSGLTLYILTSSSIGILEGRYIRKQISNMDLTAPNKRTQAGRGAKSKDPRARAYQAAVDRARQKKRGPTPRYKKRR